MALDIGQSDSQLSGCEAPGPVPQRQGPTEPGALSYCSPCEWSWRGQLARAPLHSSTRLASGAGKAARMGGNDSVAAAAQGRGT